MDLHFSVETELLDTGGAIRRVRDFLRASDPCFILGGDMLLDANLSALLKHNRERGDAVTMLLLRDPRADRFGTVGIDAEGCVRRIGRRFDLGGETHCGVYVWANVVAARAFDGLPDREVFSHFDDRLQLTKPGSSRSLWRLPSWFAPDGSRPPLGYHSDLSRWRTDENYVDLQSAARGQEFVLDTQSYPEAFEWIHGLLQARETSSGGGRSAKSTPVA